MIAQMARLHRASFERFWSAESLMQTMSSPKVFCWGSLPYKNNNINDNIAELSGFLLARWVTDEAEILTFAVAPAQRRQGIGCALLKELIATASAQALVRIFLEVEATNRAAQALYQQAGFSRQGGRENYYAGVNAILMEYKLG